MSQSILFQNEERTVVLIDVPRSIEEAQFLSSTETSSNAGQRRLISSKPPEEPFETPEPRNASPNPDLAAAIADLTAAASVEEALKVLRENYSGPWCLGRTLARTEDGRSESAQGRKRKGALDDENEHGPGGQVAVGEPLVPENSVYLHGTISAERARFLEEAPVFDLLVLDPPWPNRSARRKRGSYSTANNLDEIRETLSLIPIEAHLAPEGLVAIWITNKAGVVELLTSARGLLAEWGLELIDDWTWLKVTTSGEPIVDVNSAWRKPWERILIAKKRGSERAKLPGQRRVIASVPDLHSRKPNLRSLFEGVLPPGYKGLEVFARNLTAGWWAWGDEALKFQQPKYWVEL
ncbi:hypothetical protein VP1G_07908 [Cytospora mali]|uniref:Methyltransferase-like protein 4 n=1 Tax=Cytospora mali TaxID=578113 RepID=A0A194V9Y5_CYTMA|nr:hypothetical protein VP1G_07908 [Valsa mali var. pyri (nom. inval.)]